MSRHHSWARSNSPKMLIPTRHQIPTSPAPPDASSSCDWDCRHLPGNGKAAIGTGVALHPLASVSANSLDGTSWCFQERARRSPRYGHSWRPASNRRWMPGGRCSRGSILVGYGASMRLSLVSPLGPLHHLISRT